MHSSRLKMLAINCIHLPRQKGLQNANVMFERGALRALMGLICLQTLPPVFLFKVTLIKHSATKLTGDARCQMSEFQGKRETHEDIAG